jgi:uncharacterized metal-binding protein YceD (DUF177 family)
VLFDLRDLKHYPGKSQPFSYELKIPEFQGGNQALLQISGVVKNLSGVLMLDGELIGTFELVCDRCGTLFECEKTFSVSYTLTDRKTDEDSVFVFSGDNVELDDIFIPELILNMDMKILCDEDCDGGEFGGFIS